jgi:hypothetical protein
VGRFGYFALAICLIVFGALGLFSIGIPFLLTGLLLLVLYPVRQRREQFWPPIAAVWGFVIGYLLVAPLVCTSTSFSSVGAAQQPSRTACDGLLLHYSGEGPYNPPLLPAVLAGLAVAALTAFGLRRMLSRRGAKRDVAA